MSHRTVFALATVQMVLFFLVSNYDHYFFMLHFLGSLIYILMLLLLFYDLDEWAYVMGFVAPLFWIVLALLGGTLQASLRGLWQLVRVPGTANMLDVLGGLVLLMGVALMVASGGAFRREVWGRPGALGIVIWSTVVVGVYYAVLIAALYRMASPGA